MRGPDPKKPDDFPHLHDLTVFKKRLTSALERLSKIRPYKIESLGKVEGEDIFLLTPENPDPAKPNILTAGGFHGEEPAGPWGILEYLETATEEELKSVNHAFLPLVNPTGFSKGERLNYKGENPNRGFVPELLVHEKGATGNNDKGPSEEGKILLRHIEKIKILARDGFTTQHEDYDMNESFVFINEGEKQPSAFAKAFLNVMKKHTPLVPNGQEKEIHDGVWHNDIDGSFEGFLTREGIPRCATTETPGQQPARTRIDCNRELTRAFAQYSKKLVIKPPAGPKP